MEKLKIGFIGGGNMTGAIIGGITGSGTYPAELISVFDIHEEKRAALRERFGISCAGSEAALTEICDVIFLAVKPQVFPSMLEAVRPAVTQRKVFVSIAAGISIDSICKSLNCRCPVIRTMPNTPLLIGKGATAMCKSENVPDEVFCLVQDLFKACGSVAVLEEDQMNAVISVNGSSPAYFYLFAKAMVDSAVSQGIDSKIALELICKTLEGSAGMLRQPGATPDKLIRMVSSKGGTTLAALNVLYQGNFEQLIGKAMQACTRRAEELGKH